MGRIIYTSRWISVQNLKNQCQFCIIIWTRFGLYIIKLKVTETLIFDGLISKSIGIIYMLRQCVYHIWCTMVNAVFSCHSESRHGLVYISVSWWSLWPWHLIQLTSKSIGIIYTPRHMSVPNLTNLCQFCVYFSLEQDLVHIKRCWWSLWSWNLTNWPQHH